MNQGLSFSHVIHHKSLLINATGGKGIKCRVPGDAGHALGEERTRRGIGLLYPLQALYNQPACAQTLN